MLSRIIRRSTAAYSGRLNRRQFSVCMHTRVFPARQLQRTAPAGRMVEKKQRNIKRRVLLCLLVFVNFNLCSELFRMTFSFLLHVLQQIIRRVSKKLLFLETVYAGKWKSYANGARACVCMYMCVCEWVSVHACVLLYVNSVRTSPTDFHGSSKQAVYTRKDIPLYSNLIALFVSSSQSASSNSTGSLPIISPAP